MYLIPFEMQQLRVLFGVGRIKFKRFFLKPDKILDLQILKSISFH